MKRLITKSRGLILAGALGLSVLVLAACGNGDSTDDAPLAGEQGAASGLATLLNSTSGAAVYGRLFQGAGGPSSNATSGIWVSGQGEATAPPDLALLNLGVEAFADTVAEARSDGATAMGQVLDVLSTQGVEDRDIQTRSFDINPRYTSHEITRCVAASTGIEPELETLPQGAPVPPMSESGPVTSGSVASLEVKGGRDEECFIERESVILGFEVRNQLSVKVRDLTAIGRVIDTVTEAGGDLIRFQGVSFTIEDDEALKDQARAAAVEDLMAKANDVAALTGVELGEMVYVTESRGSVFPQFARNESVGFAAAAPTPIQVGELQVSVSLQAAFNINPSAN